MKQRILEAMQDLSEREKITLALFFHEELTVEEIATVFCFPVDTIKQIYNNALNKLKLKVPQISELQRF
jgi:RNA polymerase sigma factor for flagellar operon FliA